MRTALVTGATGFLGRHLCRQLVADGWSVTGMRRRSSNVHALDTLDLEWVVADVLDGDDVREAVDGHDYVFHLAGVGLLDADDTTVWQVNVEGTRNVLDACRACTVERVLFTSTAGTRRRDGGAATETDIAEPIGAYQRSKARAEKLVDEYASSEGETVTVHPTSVFGPGDRVFTARLLALVTDPKMIAYLPGGASIVGVRDVVRGLVVAMTDGNAGQHYILGGENLTYRRALEILAHLSDGTVPPLRVPAAAVHAAGRVIGVINDALGTRMFLADAEMAELATKELFYSSEKAADELGYNYRSIRSHSLDAIEWYLGSSGSSTVSIM